MCQTVHASPLSVLNTISKEIWKKGIVPLSHHKQTFQFLTKNFVRFINKFWYKDEYEWPWLHSFPESNY